LRMSSSSAVPNLRSEPGGLVADLALEADGPAQHHCQEEA
jgi:hypothetical protein